MKPNLDLIGALILFGLLQSILILALLLIKRADHKHRYFFGLCLVGFFLQIDAFLQQSGYMVYYLHMLNVLPLSVLLLGPFLLFYTKRLLGKKLM